MSNRARVALWAFVVVLAALLLVVSFEATLYVGSQFHRSSFTPWLFAAAADMGVIGCSIGRGLRKRAGMDARGFERVLVGALCIAFLANLLASSEVFLPDVHVMAWIRGHWYVAWPLIVVFGALVPGLGLMASDLFAHLVSEGNGDARVPRITVARPGGYRDQVALIDRERPGLSAAEVAGLLGCTPDTVRRARKAIADERLQLQAPQEDADLWE